MQSIKTLADQINSFDYHYIHKNGKAFDQPYKEQRQLRGIIAELSDSELLELKELVTIEDRLLKLFLHLEFPKPISVKAQVFKAAWYYFKKNIYTSFSECLKAAWRAIKVKARLRAGQVSFTYRKATGELRKAIGTLNSNLFEFTGKGVRKASQLDAIKYFDLDAQAWRMFRIERLIEIH